MLVARGTRGAAGKANQQAPATKSAKKKNFTTDCLNRHQKLQKHQKKTMGWQRTKPQVRHPAPRPGQFKGKETPERQRPANRCPTDGCRLRQYPLRATHNSCEFKLEDSRCAVCLFDIEKLPRTGFCLAEGGMIKERRADSRQFCH